jgi:hypothetical protein
LTRDLEGDTGGHEQGTALWVASSLKAATANRTGQFLAFGVTAAALVGGMPSLLIAVPGLFLLVFAAMFLNGHRRRAALLRARTLPIRLPEDTEFRDTRAKALAGRLARARMAIGNVVASSPRGAGFELGSALARVPQIERDAVVVLSRFDYLAHFIDTHPIGDLRADLERLKARTRHDEASRELLGGAIGRCKAHIEAVAALNGDAERLLGTAEELVGTLEQVPIDVVRLQTQRFESCAPVATSARVRAAHVLDELAALRAALDGEAGADAQGRDHDSAAA